MHLAKIVHREPTRMGFCDALGLGLGGMWIYPYWYGHNLVWCRPWSTDIIADLVSNNNLKGQITNLDLELAALITHKATILATVPETYMAATHSGSEKTLPPYCGAHARNPQSIQ